MASAAGVAATVINWEEWDREKVSMASAAGVAATSVLRFRDTVGPVSMASAAGVAATDFLIGADDEYVSMASAAGVAVTIHVQSLKKAWESQWPLRPVSLRHILLSTFIPHKVSMASTAGVAATGRRITAKA